MLLLYRSANANGTHNWLLPRKSAHGSIGSINARDWSLSLNECYWQYFLTQGNVIFFISVIGHK